MQIDYFNTGKSSLLAVLSSTVQKPVVTKIQKKRLGN